MPSVKNVGLGCLVMYEFSGAAITPIDLNSILSKESLPVVPAIDQNKVVREVGRAFRLGRGKSEDRFMGEVAFEDDSQIVVSILKKMRPGQKRVSYDQVDSIVWDKNSQGTDPWLSRGVSTDTKVIDAINVLLKKINHAQTYYGHEFIRPFLVQSELQAANALKLKRTGGGPYYVAHNNMDRVNRLERVCAQIGGVDISVLDISPTKRGKQAVERGVTSSIKETIGDLSGKIQEWKESARRPRADATESVLTQFKELHAQAEMFEDVLKIKLSSLKEEMDAAKGVLKELIEGQGDASPGLVAKFEEAIPLGVDINSDGEMIIIEVKHLEALGFKKSCRMHPAYYSAASGGGRALAQLGYRGTLKSGVALTLKKLQLEKENAA